MNRTTVSGVTTRRVSFTPVLPAAPAATGGLAVHPFVIGRPLTSLERRLARMIGPHSAFEETTRALLGSIGGRDPSASAVVPVLVPPALPAAVALGDLLATNEADAIPIGLADDTELADFPVVWWQPGETGTWLFVGSPRAELDTALWTILRGVAERYSPEDVRLAVIDSSSRRLSFAETMAHTDLVAQSDRVDLAAAVIEHVATELRRRRAEPARRPTRPRVARQRPHPTPSPPGRQSVLVGPRLAPLAGRRRPARCERRGVRFDDRRHRRNCSPTAADVFVGLLTNSDEVASLGLDELAMSAAVLAGAGHGRPAQLVQLASSAIPRPDQHAATEGIRDDGTGRPR